MPKFLEDKLKRQYGTSPEGKRKVYATMNALGAIRGSKETAKGRAMAKKHAAKKRK